MVFLEFCEKYKCDQMKNFVANWLQGFSWCFHPAELVSVAITYQLLALFRIAFLILTDISLMDLTKEHHSMISPDTFVSLALTKSVLDQHCWIIAAEEPHIVAHAEDCQDPPVCAADWHDGWWNGMAHYLLDGWNPQPFKEAVRCFKTEMQFGWVGKGCKAKMFQLLDDGIAFECAEDFITEVCDHLVVQFHLNL